MTDDQLQAAYAKLLADNIKPLLVEIERLRAELARRDVHQPGDHREDEPQHDRRPEDQQEDGRDASFPTV